VLRHLATVGVLSVTWWFDDQPEYLTTLGERVELLESP